MLRLLKISPPHGWSALLWELSIVTIGVLIALGIGEIADGVRWRAQVENADTAVTTELSQTAGVLEERELVQSCLDRRIEQLDAVLRSARRTGQLQRIGEIGKPPLRPIDQAAWGVTANSETLFHMENGRREAFSEIYAMLAPSREAGLREHEMWSTLRLLEDAPGPISAELLAEATGTLERLKFQTFLNGIGAKQIRRKIVEMGIQPSYIMVMRPDGGRRQLIAKTRTRQICQKLAQGRD